MKTQSISYNIYYKPEIDSVVMEWHGYSNSLEFRQGTELMLNTLIQNRAGKVLADIKSMTLIATEDQQWLETEFLPRATDFGFRVLAIVKPDFYFNQVAVQNIVNKSDKNKLAIQFFDNTAHAAEWLSLIEVR